MNHVSSAHAQNNTSASSVIKARRSLLSLIIFVREALYRSLIDNQLPSKWTVRKK